MDSYDRLLMLAHELGADSAKVIDPATVAVSYTHLDVYKRQR